VAIGQVATASLASCAHQRLVVECDLVTVVVDHFSVSNVIVPSSPVAHSAKNRKETLKQLPRWSQTAAQLMGI
jgi:hypothetical protein